MNKKLLSLGISSLLILVIIGTIFLPITASSSSTINVTNSSVTMDFPLALKFSSLVISNLKIVDVRLKYRIYQMSFADVTSEAVILFEPGLSVKASYTLDLRKVGGLPPGTKLKYWWLATDKDGSAVESTPMEFQISDNRYNWQSLREGKVNLFWYQGDSNFAASLMSSAQSALVQLEKDTGAVPAQDILIYIYASSNDLQGSMIYSSDWTGGVAFTNYNIIAIGISTANLMWGQEAMTHELTHNVINQITFNPYSDLPVWLNEGLAMKTQGPLSQQFSLPLLAAEANKTLFSVRSLCSPFSAYSAKASLSYAQSYSLVDYLITQYGSEKMLQLLNTFKNGSTYDDALLAVYGFTVEGLDAKWKEWISRDQ